MTKRKIKYPVERCLLSDVLPYEVPIIFTNRHFYNFLVKNKISYCLESKEISWEKDEQENPYLKQIIILLFGGDGVPSEKSLKIDPESRIPLLFKISHPRNLYRELAIMHPFSQLMTVAFYERFKELILYYSTLSSFSLRHPAKIAQYVYYKDPTHYESLVQNNKDPELARLSYEYLNSFFAYESFTNINKFYDSSLFHECEKKYENLMRLDISKCFDSIYTHSLPWALYGKEQVKVNISKSNDSFGGKFDALMQSMNYKETNGILIGPEISRIFSELILQSVDLQIKEKLKNKYVLEEGEDYQILRYIDDYFVFYNKGEQYISEVLLEVLKEYKLNLNTHKTEIYTRPIITDISAAKAKVAYLLQNFEYKVEESIEFEVDFDSEGDFKKLEEVPRRKGKLSYSANRLIRDFKIIVKESNINYSNILNYSLGAIFNNLKNIIKDYKSIYPEYRDEENLIAGLIQLLKFSFHIYTVSPTATGTIKLSQILVEILFFLKKNSVADERLDAIHQKIYKNINLILSTNKLSEHTQIETLYLLLVLTELGGDYLLTEYELKSYLGLSSISSQECNEKLGSLNYFTHLSLIFYMRHHSEYEDLRNCLLGAIKKKIEDKFGLQKKDTEITLYLFDLLSCPYIEHSYKEELLSQFDLDPEINIQDLLEEISKREWFITWDRFNLREELHIKQAEEVY